MSQFLIKTFNKSKAVKLIIVFNDRRMKTYYAVPKDGVVTINGLSLVINNRDYLISKGFPTYIYEEDNINPKSLYSNKQSDLTPTELNTIMESKVAKEILAASEKKWDTSTFAMLLSFATVVVVGWVAYNQYQINIETMQKLVEIRETLRAIGGR